MKKIWWKKLTGAVLIAALTATGFSGCGRQTKDPMENAALAKENVYRMQEVEMPDVGGSGMTVRQSAYEDGTFYLLVEVYPENGGNETDMRLLSLQDGSSTMQEVKLQISSNQEPDTEESNDPFRPGPQEGDAAEDTGGEDPAESDVQENADTESEEPDAQTDTDAESEEPDAQDTEEAVPDTDDVVAETYEYIGFNNYLFADGRLYGIKYHNFEDYSDPENYVYKNNNYVCCWDMSGALLWETYLDLEAMNTESESFWVGNLIKGSGTDVDLVLMGNSAYYMTVDADGNLGERKEFPEELGELMYQYNQMIPTRDGGQLILYNDTDDWSKQYIAHYDAAAKELDDPVQVPNSFVVNGISAPAAGLSSDLIYCNREGVFSYNIGDEQGTPMMNFINSDLEIDSFYSICQLDDDSFIGVFDSLDADSESMGWNNLSAGIFTYVKPEDIPDKKVLVLAGTDPDFAIRRRVVEYNRNSDEYRITIKSYSDFNTYENFYAGFEKLDGDIITGDMPDILIMSGQSVDKYVSKGLLADIGKFIENDEELSSVEFMDNVFKAYSVDGKLYQVIPKFFVRTMVAKEALVGDRTSWTMDDLYQLRDSQPEDTKMFGDLTRENFFNLVMTYNGAELVDINTGKCNFDSPEFVALMEFAKTLPEEIVYDDSYWENYDYESQYRENRALLCETYISRVGSLNYTINGLFGEDISYIGFPTGSGQGSVIDVGDTYCISAKSANQDAAWEFLRYYLTDEYQDQEDASTYGLSIQKDNFDAEAAQATERPYYIDYNTGEKVEYDETIYINGEEIALAPMSQEQVEEAVNMICSVEKSAYNNQALLAIINEEMGGFYAGQKTAQETAKIIQSRVQIYVDENR